MRISVHYGLGVAALFFAAPALAVAQTGASTEWGTCLGTEVGRLAVGTRNAPDSIADSAMRVCRAQEMRARNAMARAGSNDAQIEGFVRTMRSNMRQLAISTRADMGASRPAPKAAPRRAAPPMTAPAARPSGVGRQFDLVNHYNSPVVRFQAGTNSGANWSSNWLRTQVAPYATRNLRFTNNANCRQRIRIVFADQVVIEDVVNFCGASYLNVNGSAMWAE